MRTAPSAVTAIALASVLACGQETSTAPNDDTPVTETDQSVALEVLTRGVKTDSDGYTIEFAGQTLTTAPNDTVELGELDAGDYTLAVSDVAQYCYLDGQYPRSVTVPATGPTVVSVEIGCVDVPPAVDLLYVEWSSTTQQQEIFGARSDGSDAVNIMNRPNTTDHAIVDWFPAWSPDGTRIVFSSDRDQEAVRLYVVGVDGTNLTQLTNGDGNDYEAAWSPDGSKIAFQRSAGGHEGGPSDIWVIDPDGANATNVTNDPTYMDRWPSWSPDGSQIVFERIDTSRTVLALWVMNADGTDPHRLTADDDNGREPVWSPDGTMIAYRARLGFTQLDEYDIWIINADGSGRHPLSIPGLQMRPAWTADGRILFAQAEGDVGVYVINVDGSGMQQITTSGNDPEWRPRP